MVKDGVLGVVGDVLGNQALHGGYHGHVVVGVGLGDQGVYLAAHIGPVIFTDTGDADLFVERRLRRLRLAQDLLVELLPVPQAGVLDLHALRPAQLDHATRQVGDAHRFAHVEDEDLAALPLRAGLKDKLAGLWDQHEVPYDVGISDGHRAAGLDLSFENRDHGAVGAEDVAEAGGDELGLPLHHAVTLRLVEALHVDLAYSFAASHHVRRVHRLVGGHHHEAAHAVFDRKVGQDLRAEDVVLDALARVVLHHRNVLVRRGVEDIFRKEGFEYVLHPVSLGDRRHHGGAWHRREVMRHHPADVVLRSLGGVDQHHLRRCERRDLADDLAADASGGTGDQDALPTEGLGHGFQVDADLVTRQKILDADLLQGRRSLDRIMLGVNDIVGREYSCAALQDVVLKSRVVAEPVDPARSDQHGGDPFAADHIRQTGVNLVDRLAHQARAVGSKRRIVGDEASETVVHRFLAADRLRESDAAGADAIDEDILRTLRPEIGVIDPFDRNSKQPHQAGRNGFRDQDLPHLHVGEHPRRAAVREEMDGYHRQRGASHRLRHTDEVVER